MHFGVFAPHTMTPFFTFMPLSSYLLSPSPVSILPFFPSVPFSFSSLPISSLPFSLFTLPRLLLPSFLCFPYLSSLPLSRFPFHFPFLPVHRLTFPRFFSLPFPSSLFNLIIDPLFSPCFSSHSSSSLYFFSLSFFCRLHTLVIV